MGNYSKNSGWDDEKELVCFWLTNCVVKLNKRGKQREISQVFSTLLGLSEGTINAKIGNYKSLMGVIGKSNYSKNSKRVYETYKNLSLESLYEEVKKSIKIY